MTVMSTPYGTIMSTPFDPVMSATPSHLHQHHPPPLPLTAMPLRRRRSSKVGTPVNIRRTASTPNVRAAAMDPNPGPYGSGGKGGRNKLGYHRTSVACGHCRRRKIRCLLATDDPHGRCSNCIRLKKECNFFPVDQPPRHVPSTSSLHKAEPGSSDASSASASPPHGHGHGPGRASFATSTPVVAMGMATPSSLPPYHPYSAGPSAPGPSAFPPPPHPHPPPPPPPPPAPPPPHPPPLPAPPPAAAAAAASSSPSPSSANDGRPRPDGEASMPGKPGLVVPSLGSTPLTGRPHLPQLPSPIPLPSTGYDPTRAERPTGWATTASHYLEPSPVSGEAGKPVLEDPSASFWRLAESPMATGGVPSSYQPSAPALPMIHHRESVSVYPYSVPRDDLAWPLPSRSMSFGQLEGLGVHPSHPYPAGPAEFKPPPPAPLYPPSYGGAGGVHHYPMTSTPEPVSGPPDGRVPAGTFVMHPPWHPSYTGSSMSAMAGPGKGIEPYHHPWFPDPNRLSQVDEEAHPGPMNEDPSTVYPTTTPRSS